MVGTSMGLHVHIFVERLRHMFACAEIKSLDPDDNNGDTVSAYAHFCCCDILRCDGPEQWDDEPASIMDDRMQLCICMLNRLDD